MFDVAGANRKNVGISRLSCVVELIALVKMEVNGLKLETR